MAKTLIIYPFADVSIRHTKSNTGSTGAALVNAPNNDTSGYLGHTITTGNTTYTSTLTDFEQASNITLGKIRINSVTSANFYLSHQVNDASRIDSFSLASIVSIDGVEYNSSDYNTILVNDKEDTTKYTNASLTVSPNSINRIVNSLDDVEISMAFTTSAKGTKTNTSQYKSFSANARIYNANVTISYDDVFDCAAQVITGNGISTATVSSSEVIDGETCTFSATVENGYLFDGWYDSDSFDGDPYSTDTTFTLKITENTTLYPKAIKEGVVPPEEDPTKIFYPITISSINARTSPSKGTTKVESGTSKTIKITPKDPLLTLATDNGTDITNQLVGNGTPISYPSVSAVTGAQYGFNLNSSTGYYVSTNNGQASTAAVARLNFNFPVMCLVTIQYINYAEAGNDFGIFGNIDTALSRSNTIDTNAKLVCNNASYNISTPQTLTYEVDSGSHYIDIKYRKNDAVNSNNDTLQFKVLSIEPLEVYDFYYTYTIQDIDEDHTLNFVFGNVEYYFVTSQTSSNAQLYPYGQTVILPGDEYRLTIVPENQNEIVTLTDNGTDVTSQLQVVNVEKEEDGQTVIIKNYIYRLANVQAAHNLSVETTKPIIPLLVKINGSWVSASYYGKANDTWIKLSLEDIYAHNGVKWIKDDEIKTNNIMFIGNLQ